MLWLLARTGADHRELVLAACDCAETALIHVPAGEDRPRQAIETTRAWCRGEATIEQVRKARDAAAEAAAAEAAWATARAAWASSEAAWAVEEAAWAPSEAAWAAARAAAAGVEEAEAVAVEEAEAVAADLVRARFPTPPALVPELR
jgi:hypothetical protein